MLNLTQPVSVRVELTIQKKVLREEADAEFDPASAVSESGTDYPEERVERGGGC